MLNIRTVMVSSEGGQFKSRSVWAKARVSSEVQRPSENSWIADVHTCSYFPGNPEGWIQGS